MTYTARDVEKMLGLRAAQVRAYVRAGFLAPERGPRGELRFTFQDLVLLRTARHLLAAEVPPLRVRRALRRLREQLPDGRPLTGVHIRAQGGQVLVRDGRATWQPESGQVLFDFSVAELAREVASLAATAEEKQRPQRERSAEAWYERGCELEERAPDEAREAYRRALALDPRHADAHVNLGRLLHDAGDFGAAESHYRAGLAARPDDATAAFNLGVALEDLGRADDAVAAYEQALASDPRCADAHYNLSRLSERLGRRAAALRHLRAYARLIGK
jgi:tetratricopeptide (TPR) repeat protein